MPGSWKIICSTLVEILLEKVVARGMSSVPTGKDPLDKPMRA
jgi:hypothetical protein